ncbi:mannitol dehydrogenase family protein [Saccharicrinis sp. GN24d3]|uniref:mannitol dehydrogenase family protein n=1 Tax=Saccharicrinis sp. GN24d3 TaxID=3458416 RepID=UPI004035A1E6
MKTLNKENLKSLPSDVAVPTYDRSAVKASIVHVGIGGFHRAHQAFYADQLLEKGVARDCGICGVGLLEFDRKICDILTEQDGLYTLMTKELDGSVNARVIGSMVEVMFAPDNKQAVIEKMAHPETKIISLTITEGGYNLNEATGEFDFENESIKWDLAHPEDPKTIFGFLTQALLLRKNKGVQGCSIQSCDNIQGNGAIARQMLCSFIGEVDNELLEWVNKNVTFPNSMVDRITPATVPADIEMVYDKFKIKDRWPVVCESYIQWVVEDDFVSGRPAYEEVGVQFVEDVAPYEKMKLQLLNAGHSVLGMLGARHGYNSIDEAASDEDFSQFLRNYMDAEATPVLSGLEGMDLGAYKDSLMARFRNKYIRDQISRICLQSSAKMPKFILPTVKSQLEGSGNFQRAAFVIAAWCKYNEGADEKGNEYEIEDVISEELQAAARRTQDDPLAFLKIESVFGDLVHQRTFVDAYQSALEALNEFKIKECVKAINTKNTISWEK